MSGLVFTIVQFRPDWAVHPGQTLSEILTECGMSQAALARSCSVSQKHVSRVVTGKAGIGPGFALALEEVLRVDAGFWVRMQATYDLFQARSSAETPR